MNTYNCIVAVVIIYYPNADELTTNINQFIKDVDRLIIWDNTPISSHQKFKLEMPEYDSKIIILGTGKNEGIAYGINHGINWAIDNNYKYILTMDQDSYWDNFSFYIQQFIKFKNDPTNGIFSPVIYENKKRDLPELQVVKDAITSGTIYSLEMVKKIGLLREDFFIDAVDLEYCYWAKRNRYKTVLLGGAFLKQRYGSPMLKKLFTLTFYPSNYSPMRIFYIIRNHIFLWREYPELSNFEKKRIIKIYIIGRFIEVILFEKNKFQKLFSIFKGIVHGVLGIGQLKRNSIIK